MEGRLGRLLQKAGIGRPQTWENLEQKIPNLKDRMAQAEQDRQAGRGDILNSDGTISLGEVRTNERLLHEGAVDRLTRDGRVILAHPVSVANSQNDTWEEKAFVHVPPPKTTFGDGAWMADGGFVFFNQKGQYIDTAETFTVEIEEAETLLAERNRALKDLGLTPSVYTLITDDDVQDKWPGGHHVDPRLFQLPIGRVGGMNN